VYFTLNKKRDKLHLLKGLKRILLDIDKAIRIIRETEEEAEVVPNLMIGFGIDQIQAEYVAEIRLRNINKEYILKRVREEEALRDEIEDLEDLVNSPGRVKKLIIRELEDVKKKYGQPRLTTIVYEHELPAYDESEDTPDYPVTVFLSREGYFKKITPQSLRMADTQKYKDGDGPRQSFETTSRAEVMFFTNRQQVYKCRLSDFDDAKASVLGDYLPSKLGMDPEEAVVSMVLPGDYSGALLFFFENGKAARVELTAYATTSNRRRLTGAYSDKSPLAALLHLKEDRELALFSSENRVLIFNTALLAPKSTRSTQGVQVMTLKAKHRLTEAAAVEDAPLTNLPRYRCRAIPAAGALLREEDGEQMRLL
jgi:DNA gyrase subunit A